MVIKFVINILILDLEIRIKGRKMGLIDRAGVLGYDLLCCYETSLHW